MIERQRSVVAQLGHFAHEYLIWLLVGSYAIAAVVPAFGLWVRDVSLGEMNVLHSRTQVSVPMLLLALLLFNAGMNIRLAAVHEWLRNGAGVDFGLAGKLLYPIVVCAGR
jgi:bile acid:Na+ symporter, BASS family